MPNARQLAAGRAVAVMTWRDGGEEEHEDAPASLVVVADVEWRHCLDNDQADREELSAMASGWGRVFGEREGVRFRQEVGAFSRLAEIWQRVLHLHFERPVTFSGGPGWARAEKFELKALQGCSGVRQPIRTITREAP